MGGRMRKTGLEVENSKKDKGGQMMGKREE